MIVRQHDTPYWTVVEGDGCVSKDPQTGWTAIDVHRAGTLRVRAEFSLAAALRAGPGEPRRRSGRTSAVSPPVERSLTPG